MARLIVNLRILLLTSSLGLLPYHLAAEDINDNSQTEKPRSLSNSHESSADFIALTKRLDSRSYAVRRLAQEQLQSLAAEPNLHTWLADQIELQWVRADLSQETRAVLQPLREQLPAPNQAPPKKADQAELDRLMLRLNSNTYADRVGAAARLQWLGRSPAWAVPIMDRVKRQCASGDVNLDSFARLESVRRSIWDVWAAAQSNDDHLPQVPDSQIETWLVRMAANLETTAPRAASGGLWESQPGLPMKQQLAKQEILDLLGNDREAARVIKLLEKKMNEARSPEVAVVYRELLDLSRPSMVAECWIERKLFGEQHLIIGVPSQAAGALRPSHFDKIDDKTARCVSGNSLSPGDYPVGVAFPHPTLSDAFFQLVNLPTPRRQISYSHYVKADESARLIAISRRTLNGFLKEGRALSDSEVGMLSLLDAREVSRFAGPYLLKVDDRVLEQGRETAFINMARPFGQPSLLNSICVSLAIDGGKEAIPGLLDAIRLKRFSAPDPRGPYRMPFVAALAIAHRDPWREVDHWLAGILDDSDPLIVENETSPTIGGSAAGLLLSRHEESGGSLIHGLEPSADPMFAVAGLTAYRYRTPDDAARIKAWWSRESQLIRAKRAP